MESLCTKQDNDKNPNDQNKPYTYTVQGYAFLGLLLMGAWLFSSSFLGNIFVGFTLLVFLGTGGLWILADDYTWFQSMEKNFPQGLFPLSSFGITSPLVIGLLCLGVGWYFSWILWWVSFVFMSGTGQYWEKYTKHKEGL